MIGRYLLLALIVCGTTLTASAQQNPCDNPYPDSCQYPDTCCAIPIDDCPFVPGDYNNNGQFNGLDIVFLVNYFKGGPALRGLYSSFDLNCDCKVNGLDIVYMVRYLRGQGNEPRCCLYQCQVHPFSGTIGDLIWLDSNRNGIQDDTPEGPIFMDVQLLDCSDPPNVLAMDTTDAEGHYSFTGLSSGNYRIRLRHSDDFYYSPKDQGDNDELDSDADQVWGITDCLVLGQDVTDNSWDIGYHWPRIAGDIGDFVWNDSNHDGIQGDGERGLPGVTVTVYNRHDTLTMQTAVTDSAGRYFFADLPQGYYLIHVTPPAGFMFSPQNEGGNDSLDSDVDPATGIMTGDELYEGETDLSWDAGLYSNAGTGVIGDRIWGDTNRNGIQDEDELGMRGMIVDLLDCADSAHVLSTDTTDSEGLYHFEGLPPGHYRVHLWHSDEFFYSPKDQGSNDNHDSDANSPSGVTDCFELREGQNDPRWDIGIYWPTYRAIVGDFVWNDTDMDGIQDSGERGIPGVAVNIYNRYDSSLVETMMTDITGHYMFDSLFSGYYYIQVIPPQGYLISPQDQGDNDALDSDVDPLTGLMSGDELYSDEIDSTWDAGMYRENQGDGCTHNIGYWKNRAGFGPHDDLITPLLPIWLGVPDGGSAINVTTAQIAYDVFRMMTYGHPSNGITKLYARLLAAKLNIANGANPDDIAFIIAETDAFLGIHGWEEWDELTQEQRRMVQGWMVELNSYNGGDTGPGPCGADEDK